MIKIESRKRDARTRKKLKAAALDIFSEKTVDEATIEKITKKAEAGKETLYPHCYEASVCF